MKNNQRRLLWLGGGLLLVTIIVIIALTAVFVPQDSHPAFDVAVEFVRSAGKGEEEQAMSLLSSQVQAHVSANCPDGRVSACVDAYSPPIWGDFLNAVYRRAQPQGQNLWHVLTLATYAEDQGFSGVCVYTRVEKTTDETWLVTRWSGWISCDLPNAGLSSLMSDSAENRVP